MVRALSFSLVALLLPLLDDAVARDRPYEVTEEREECADYDPLRRPFFGDTHVHTAYSFDARGQDTRNTPREAYRFAKGEPLGIQPYDEEGNPTRTIEIDRPLDWTMISDHAEFLGEVRICRTPGTWSYYHPACIAHRNSSELNKMVLAAYGLIGKRRWGICGDDNETCFETARGVWSEIQAAAEEAYDRSAACDFTSFVGYEWTASVGEGSNLHRNVLFRNDQVPDLPVSWIETPTAMDLWDHLERDCVDGLDRCDVFTIPHNSNLSGGLMFQTARIFEDDIPGPIDAEEAERRSRWEPLVEMMQHKGDSECDPLAGSIWADDEACGFEKLHYDRFGAMQSSWSEWRQATPSNFVRDALKQGLRYEAELGSNPLRYGIIASTDTHIAAPGLVAEKNHPGHGGAGKGGGAASGDEFPDDFEFGPGGLAVVWAEENTRDALFAAMQRRETYGTSGTRPVVRFFGGWDYPESLCDDPEMVAKGYAGGVPMGGSLSDLPASDAAPRFVAWAAQDPGTWDQQTTPLQRIQLVKGWVVGRELHEKVIDIAGGPNGAGVDPKTCEPYGTGAPSLCTVWTDPDFDPRERAFYYLRVLENPTCRWSQYFCNAKGVDCAKPGSIPEGLEMCCSDEHRAVIQERAWTSPIWYAPGDDAPWPVPVSTSDDSTPSAPDSATEEDESAAPTEESPLEATAVDESKEDFPTKLLWGDTHVHSSFSMDASTMGNTRLPPSDAYRFAKGEAVTTNTGKTAQLETPLDFLVVSDHAEYMGVLPKLRAGDPTLLSDPAGKKLVDALAGGPDSAGRVMLDLIESLMSNEPLIDNDEAKRSIWSEITRMADDANEPGRFSALIGYEWTSMPKGDNLHRVVVYRDAADRAAEMVPVSAFDGERPEDLWAFMARYEDETGGRILAIPHNGNVSNGRMFAVEDSAGRAIDDAYASLRARWEPLVEVTQIKGDGETHPLLSPDDEFADFETWDKGNLNIGATTPKTPEMLPFEYARSALRLGLDVEARTGTNPFKFGMIGSTDAHTSLATGDEDNFWGKAVMVEPGQPRTEGVFLDSTGGEDFQIRMWQQVASGYAAVWAKENTRASIFDAMKRKEVYATTGPRMAVRFFGGWAFEPGDAARADGARIGYRKGVPMGGDLPEPAAEAPTFLVTATKDPNGANLDRIQIVKGWRSADGELHEKVYDVALSDDRTVGPDGAVPPITSTVDAATATYTNTVGDALLAAHWRDPDFDPGESAFYYARVLQIPTPRWTTYDAVRLGSNLEPETPAEVQDRAYTSPIWYTPAG